MRAFGGWKVGAMDAAAAEAIYRSGCCGRLSAALFATSLGSLVGSLLSYWMGYYGGKPVVLKVGRYLLLNPHDLEAP